MTENAETKTKVMHLRIPADLHKRVAEYAARTHRSLNGAAIALMEGKLDQEAGQGR